MLCPGYMGAGMAQPQQMHLALEELLCVFMWTPVDRAGRQGPMTGDLSVTSLIL